MDRFIPFSSRVLPLPIDNIDTDQIVPARFLKTTAKTGLADNLFYDWRYDEHGHKRPDFVLNQPKAEGAHVLLAGDNFGCGSSREHAPWALTQFGFKAVISTSFADIFRGNALKNALLPIVVPPAAHKALFAVAERDPHATVRVELADQKLILPDGSAIVFPIDEFAKFCMLEGVDELGYILKQEPAIAGFEAKRALSVNTLEAV